MKKYALTEWAAIAEILGAVAVVISLMFVAYSINRNTNTLYASSENFVYQLQDDEWSDLAGDPHLAEILSKVRSEKVLSDSEEIQWSAHMMRMLNRWELVYYRYKEDQMTAQQWEDWDRSFSFVFLAEFPAQRWPDWRYGYGEEFVDHIDVLLSEQ